MTTRIVSFAGCIAALLLVLVPAPHLHAQGDRFRLFLDCASGCDDLYLRTEITTVDWVTDRQAADVHVIATELGTGAGGREVVLRFLGRGALDSLHDTHRFTVPPNTAADATRRQLARTLRLGLARYQLVHGTAGQLDVTTLASDRPVDRSVSPTTDKWNHWVFRLSANGGVEGEARFSNRHGMASIRASRVTEDWKVSLLARGWLDRSTFELDDGRSFTANRDRHQGQALVVRALGNHFSAGMMATLNRAPVSNLDLHSRLAPALEFDLYPYSEAAERGIVFLYSLGLNRYDYAEETVYGQLAETRPDQRLMMTADMTRPWGALYVSGVAESFLDDWSQNRLTISGGVDLRVSGGLSLEVGGSYSRVRNQIALARGDASPEEVLLQLRDLATGYRGEMYLGLNYTFGSVLNSIVNPRFNEW